MRDRSALDRDSCVICCGVKVNRPEENGSQEADSESTENGEVNAAASDKLKVPKDIFDFYEKMDRDEDDETELQTVSFEINQNSLEKLQKRFVTSVHSFTLVVPSTRRSTLGDRAFPVAAARAWKSLPPSVRSTSSLASFCLHLETHLFAASFPR